MRKPSIQSVAQAAGVSVGTVSNVLNSKGNVTAEVAGRVREAVASLGYVRDRHAARLRAQESFLVGLIVPDLVNPMFAAFVSMTERLARRDGYELIVVSAQNDAAEEAVRLGKIREWRPAGLIVIPVDGALGGRLPAGLGLPMVVADRIPDREIADLVAVDNAAAAARITRSLAEAGVSDCLVLGTSLGISNVRERWQGAEDGALAMRVEMLEVGLGDRAPQRLVDRLSAAPRPGALFCLDHETTLAVYLLCGDLGLRIPEDIALASFDEMEWMRLVRPGITAVRQPVEEMAESAWAMLRRRITGDTAAPRSRRLGCAVTIRGSTPQNPARTETGARGLTTGGN